MSRTSPTPISGDALINHIAYSYLLNLHRAINAAVAAAALHDLRLFMAVAGDVFHFLQRLFRISEDYQPRTAYARNYTQLFDALEGLAESFVTEGKLKRLNPVFQALFQAVYMNHNDALERAGAVAEEVMKRLPTHTDYPAGKKAVRGALLSVDAQNEFLPEAQDTWAARGSAFVDEHYKPQRQTNIPNIKRYDYRSVSADAPVEHRFGTQAQKHARTFRVNPLFEIWLGSMSPRSEDAVSPYVHVYFNNLRRGDFASIEKKFEDALSRTLHGLEARYPQVAVINLPADGGYLDKNYLSEAVLPSSCGATLETMLQETLQALQGKGSAWVNGLFISRAVRVRLFGTDSLVDGRVSDVLRILLDRSFQALGFVGSVHLKPAQIQAVFFHFIKYELTHFILDTLKPRSFNISCKDAIDRGGAGSAYYNLIQSIRCGHPLTESEFHRALHAAPTFVKGRSMNHHIVLLWNVVNAYVQANAEAAPGWLKTWCAQHQPKGWSLRTPRISPAPVDPGARVSPLALPEGSDVTLMGGAGSFGGMQLVKPVGIGFSRGLSGNASSLFGGVGLPPRPTAKSDDSALPPARPPGT